MVCRPSASGASSSGAATCRAVSLTSSRTRRTRRRLGFEVDIAAAIARDLGLGGARFFQVQWSNLVPALERGDVDVALNGLEDTPERRARLRLSRPVLRLSRGPRRIRRGAPYATLDDLRGKRVGTLNQTVAFELLQARPLETVLYEGQEEPYFDLRLGRVDAVLLDHIIAERYGCPLAGIECISTTMQGGYVVGMRGDDAALAAAVDGAVARLIVSGELRRILEAWHLWDDAQQGLVGARRPVRPARVRSFVARPPPAGAVRRGGGGDRPALGGGVRDRHAARHAAGRGADGGGASRPGARGRLRRGAPRDPGTLAALRPLLGLAPGSKLGPLTAATLGLGLNYAAYEAEVYRGALMAVPRGQTEAAAALGLGPWQVLRHVMFPQALRTALPAVTNDFVSLLKDSSLVSVLTVVELTKRMTIAAVEIRSWLGPGLLFAALYFVMSFPLSRLSRRLEARLENDPHPRFA